MVEPCGFLWNVMGPSSTLHECIEPQLILQNFLVTVKNIL